MPNNIDLLTTPLLHQRAIADAERTLSVTHRDHRRGPQAELDALRARWDAEAPARALRAELERRGFRQSQHDHNGLPAWQVWVRKNKATGRWDRFTPERVLEAAGLPLTADDTADRFAAMELD